MLNETAEILTGDGRASRLKEYDGVIYDDEKSDED